MFSITWSTSRVDLKLVSKYNQYVSDQGAYRQ